MNIFYPLLKVVHLRADLNELDLFSHLMKEDILLNWFRNYSK